MRQLVLVAVAVAIAVLIIDRVGRIDWSAVGDALARLSWWQPLVVVGGDIAYRWADLSSLAHDISPVAMGGERVAGQQFTRSDPTG